MAKIEVLIPVYNGEAFIKQQIESIIGSAVASVEIVLRISDDLSHDDSTSVIRSIAHKNVILQTNNKNLGLKGNITNLVKSTKEKCFFLSDQDDVWINEKIMVHLLEHVGQQEKLVISNCIITDEFLAPKYQNYFLHRQSSCDLLSNWYKFRFLGSCYSIFLNDKSDLVWCMSNCKSPHDVIIYLYFKLSGKPIRMLKDDFCMLYRRHDQAVSHFKKITWKRLRLASKNRFFFLYDLVVIWKYLRKRKFFN